MALCTREPGDSCFHGPCLGTLYTAAAAPLLVCIFGDLSTRDGRGLAFVLVTINIISTSVDLVEQSKLLQSMLLIGATTVRPSTPQRPFHFHFHFHFFSVYFEFQSNICSNILCYFSYTVQQQHYCGTVFFSSACRVVPGGLFPMIDIRRI